MTENIWEKQSRKLKTNPKYREIDVQRAVLSVTSNRIKKYLNDEEIIQLAKFLNRLEANTNLHRGLLEDAIMKDSSNFVTTIDREGNVWVGKNKIK